MPTPALLQKCIFFLAVLASAHLGYVAAHIMLHPQRHPHRALLYQVSRRQVSTVAARLGSNPPRCQGKCRVCHPCYAIQLPLHNMQSPIDPYEYNDSHPYNTNNYKPEHWKCRCGNTFFNP
eukprot:c2407_g1_i1 orf=162-524(+)